MCQKGRKASIDVYKRQKDDDRGICEQMDQTLEEMRQDGTSLKIIEKYLDDPEKYLEVNNLGY